jgi:hypothetical protein
VPSRSRARLLHRLPDELAHLVQLLWRRLLVFKSDDIFADRVCAEKRRHIARDAEIAKYSASVFHLMSAKSCSIRFFNSSLSGPIDSPSPMISVVTPWRISLCDRPSWINDTTDQESMLMKPGATTSPLASITVFAFAFLKSPSPAIRSPQIARSTCCPSLPVLS